MALKKRLLLPVLAIAMVLSFISAAIVFTVGVSAETAYPSEFHAMERQTEADNIYQSLVFYNTTTDSADTGAGATSVAAAGSMLSRNLSDNKWYASAVAWTAPAAGTLVRDDGAALDMQYFNANTVITVLKGAIPADGRFNNDLEVLYTHTYDEAAPEAEGPYSFYNEFCPETGLAFEKGESLIVAISASESAVKGATAESRIGSLDLAFAEKDGQGTEIYSFIRFSGNSSVPQEYKKDNGNVDIAKWCEDNESNGFSFWALCEPDAALPTNPIADISELVPSEYQFFPKEMLNTDIYMGVYTDPADAYGNWTYDGSPKDEALNIFSTNNRCRITPRTDHTPIIAWRAPEDGSLGILDLKLEIEAAGGDGVQYAVLLKSKNKLYSLTSQTWQDLVYGSPAEHTALPSVQMAKGDELWIALRAGATHTKDDTKLDVTLQFTGDGMIETVAMNAAAGKFNEQGKNNFYFYESPYLLMTSIFDVNGAEDYGAIVQNELPWQEYASNGSGGWMAQQEVYVAPRTDSNFNRDTGTSKSYSFHTFSIGGKYTAFRFTAKKDMTAYITELYMAKSSWAAMREQGGIVDGNDGICYAIMYHPANTELYYSVLGDKWTDFNSTEEDDGILSLTSIPGVEMKEGDELLIAFGNNDNMTIDFINQSRVNLLASYADGSTETLNMNDDFVFDYEVLADNGVRIKSVTGKGNWSMAYLNVSGDYSTATVGEAQDADAQLVSVGSVESAKLSFNSLNGYYYSADNVDARITLSDAGIDILPGLQAPIAFKLDIGAAGRIQIHADSFITFNNDGMSNGIRFMILRNDEVVYPASGGWKNIRDNGTLYLSDIPVFSVGADDSVYFVFDSFGDTTSDETNLDIIALFAAEGENSTAVYHLMDEALAHANGDGALQDHNGWSYVTLSLLNAPQGGVFVNAGSGMDWTVFGICAGAAVIVAAGIAVAVVFIKKKRGKKTDEKQG